MIPDWQNRLSRTVSSPYAQKLALVHARVRDDQLPGPVTVAQRFSSPFGPVFLAGEIGAPDLPHMRYKALKVLHSPPELQLPRAALEAWTPGDPLPTYRHTLENERYKLQGCYVNEGMLYVGCVTAKAPIALADIGA